jgi:hypothetical protein
METLIGTTLLLLALAVLALRYGVDSRAGLRTAEQRLAANGFVWPARVPAQNLVRRPPIGSQDRQLNGPVRVT